VASSEGDDWAKVVSGRGEEVVGEVGLAAARMLRQAIITSKTASAIAVANATMIVPNERTYITPY